MTKAIRNPFSSEDIVLICSSLKEQGIYADKVELKPIVSTKSYASTLRKIEKNEVNVDSLRVAPDLTYSKYARIGKLSKYFLVGVVSRPIADMPLLVNARSTMVSTIAKWRLSLNK